MRVKIDKADKMFSKYIRTRDGRCQRCGKKGSGKEGITGLQCSHYFGRGRETTRFLPSNCDTLCFPCHVYWGSTDREAYRTFKLKQLGQKEYDKLVVTANMTMKKDRTMAYILAKELLKGLNERKN